MPTIASYLEGTGQSTEFAEGEKRPTKKGKDEAYKEESVNRISSSMNYFDNLKRCLHMSSTAKAQRAKLAKAQTQTLTSTKPLSD